MEKIEKMMHNVENNNGMAIRLDEEIYQAWLRKKQTERKNVQVDAVVIRCVDCDKPIERKEYMNETEDAICEDCYNETTIEEEQEIIGYQCLGCGNTQATTGFGYTCNKCMGGCLDEIYG